ncbi:lysylphosphatidylglycerol synthase domain-containing protein [Longimicrobium sp.]|uniref:lysylphosphatidylglycerol synthase domain-containing protein n=1 Tax=Longimicrobium sp. TaxID=2029185 RepID=UPI002B90517D|nr:lysylphosphatidylglycerol synthase domain-containing protein [Longimicrobium sp.]HSU18045.1 lysylphosphatidylglycerol synthase domain-containing protein [Longimicrobium sp.]
MKLSPAWKKAATALLIAAAAFFLVRSIARDWPRVRAFDWQVDPLLLAASIALLVAMLVWGVWVWGMVLRRFEHAPVRFGTLLRIWFLSNLARYIPGTVFQFLTAAQLSRSAGLSAAVLLTSLLVHTGITLLSALLVSAWTLAAPLFPALPPPAVIAIGAAATVAAAGFVHPRFLNAMLGIIPRLLKRETIRWNGSWGYGLGLLAMSLASWAMYGAAYWLFLRSLTPMAPAHLPMVSGVNALSFAAGWIVFFAPGGLGVREYAMKQLLLPLLPVGVAALISIAARLWNIAGELLGGALVLALFRRSSADRSAVTESAGPAAPRAGKT